MKNPQKIFPQITNTKLSPRTLDRLHRQQEFALQHAEKFAKLTKREREVLGLICRGMTNEEIATRLFRSVHTVRTHRNRIWRQLEIRSVVEAVWWGQSFELV